MRTVGLLLVLFLCCTDALLFKWSEYQFVQEIGANSGKMGNNIRLFMKNKQFDSLLMFLRVKSFDFLSIYNSFCSKLNLDYLLSLREKQFSKDDLKLLMSSSCVAGLPTEILSFATMFEGSVMESEKVVKMQKNPAMAIFIDRAFAEEERAHLVRWDLIPYVRTSTFAAQIIYELRHQERWQVINAASFTQDALLTNTCFRRTKMVQIVAQKDGYSMSSLLLKMITLKAILSHLELELWTLTKIGNRDLVQSNSGPTKNAAEAELFKLQEQTGQATELASKIMELPANSASTVHEILLLTTHEIVFGDWFENLLMIVDLKAISGTVLIPILDQMFRKRLSSACIPRILELLLESRVPNAVQIVSSFLLQFPHHLPVLYEKHRDLIPSALIIKFIPLSHRILNNFKNARRPKYDDKVIFLQNIGNEEELNGLASLMANLACNFKIGLMDRILISIDTVDNEACDHQEFRIQELISSYFEMFLSVPKLYNFHGRTSDDRPIISLSLKFAPMFWGQFAYLMSFSFALKLTLPFVFEKGFFEDLLNYQNKEFVSDDAVENGAFFEYLERTLEFRSCRSIIKFVSYWSKIISELGTAKKIDYPLAILLPGTEEETQVLQSQDAVDRVRRLYRHAKSLFVAGIKKCIDYSDFSFDELYFILFKQ